MSKYIVVEHPDKWPLRPQDTEVITPGQYFTDPKYQSQKGMKVINICRSYAYQSLGYYVSLLAEAREHKVIPSVETIQDMRFPSVLRSESYDLEDLIQKCLKAVKDEKHEMYIYFGRTRAENEQKLARQFFNLLPAPVLSVTFSKKEKGRWELQNVKTVELTDLPESDEALLDEALLQYLIGRGPRKTKADDKKRYDLAILVNPEDEQPPSDARAMQRFLKAADKVGLNAELITKADFGKLIQFDALFIRETTYVNHHTFRFSRKAEADGLVVIDDPTSILRCTNKVYLSELLNAHKILTPKYLILKEGAVEMNVVEAMGYPFILKEPDGAFSKGVKKVKDLKEFQKISKEMFKGSELLIAQEYLPTDYDWRIGVLDGKLLYACKYFMVKGHWQIYEHGQEGGSKEGTSATVAVEDLHPKLAETALKCSNLIGKGLYGVDIKEVGGKFYVIEVNDNPSLDSGVEDRILKEDLYLRVMQTFVDRIKALHANI